MIKMSNRHQSAALALLAAGLLIGAADGRAQTVDTPPRADPEQHETMPPPPTPGAPGPVRNDTPETLTQKLNQTQGVIAPPKHVDPDIQKPAPDVGPQSTPVIPPPGTPGNNPNVQPK
jgi:hypothetical protein